MLQGGAGRKESLRGVLGRVSCTGRDVLYILTGQETDEGKWASAPQPATPMTGEEAERAARPRRSVSPPGAGVPTAPPTALLLRDVSPRLHPLLSPPCRAQWGTPRSACRAMAAGPPAARTTEQAPSSYSPAVITRLRKQGHCTLSPLHGHVFT